MKKNRLTLMSSLVLMLLAAFTFSTLQAQEAREEKKIVKIKVTEDDNGEVTVDTTIIFDEDFEGDWEQLIDDDEILKNLEELDIDLEIDEDGKVYILKSPSSQKKGYFYTTSTDGDGSETHVEVKHLEEDILVNIVDGDTTITVIVKPEGDMKECQKKVMVWHADADCKHKDHSKMLKSQKIDVNMEVTDGDTLMTYTIEIEGDGDEDGGNVLFWTSDKEGDGEHEIIIKKIDDKHNEFEFFDTDEAIIITQTIIVSDLDAQEKDMLSDAGIKFGNAELHTKDFSINMDPDSENLKISFEVQELKNVSIAMLDGIGNQIYLEELKALDGTYIREIKLPSGPGDYYFHVKSAKRSLTRKISLD